MFWLIGAVAIQGYNIYQSKERWNFRREAESEPSQTFPHHHIQDNILLTHIQ